MIPRYSRHMIIPEIGEKGQDKLSSSKVLVVGAGGLGSPVLYYLASAGIGHIKIIDSDTVDITNLNRQFIHFECDKGREKAQSAKEKIQNYNEEIDVSTVTVRLDEVNIQKHVSDFDIVMSCVDNRQTRLLLNSSCVKRGIPLVDGGVNGFNGYTLTMIPGITPCYNCILPKRDQLSTPIGVLGATAGVIGSMMAVMTIKYLLGIQLDSFLYYIDLLSFTITPIHINKNPDCLICNTYNPG